MNASEHRARIEGGLPAPPLPPITRTLSVDEALAWYRVPGLSVCVFRGGEIEWSAGYGMADAGRATPVTIRSIFQACSISKPVAAMAALRLVCEGALDLDRDINEVLRSWKVPANDGWQPQVTLRHLLTHTAGLYCWYPGYSRDSHVPTLLQTLRGEPPANTPPVVVTAVPGTAYRYSGSHYSVLQQLLEDVTGKPFPALMRELVLDPLGMDCTSYDQAFPETHDDVAAGHNFGGEPIEGRWRELPEMAGAGMWTTPVDLARLALDVQAAWAGRDAVLLDGATAQAALTPAHGNRGLGWEVHDWDRRRHFLHGGSNIGYKCRLICDAERGNGVAVMTNGEDGEQVYSTLLQAISREYGWALPGHGDDIFRFPAGFWSVPNPEPELLNACTGEYITESGVLIIVTAGPSGLEAGFEGQPTIPLQPTGGLTFRSSVVNVQLAFVRGENGLIEDCLLHQNEEVIPASRVG